MTDTRKVKILLASAATTTVLGSIHAFSIFVPGWERVLVASRAEVSLIYSIALISLTAAVLYGHRVYSRCSPSSMFALVGGVAALGLYLSAHSTNLYFLYLTYGVIFGAANGLGYGYSLHLSGQAMPSRRGFAMGVVTAFYAVGATAAPVLFGLLITRGGNSLALAVCAAIVLGTLLFASMLLRDAGIRFKSEVASAVQPLSAAQRKLRLLFWFAYGSAVIAGLMVISHAYGIATWLQLNASLAIWATTMVAFGNMLGGFSAGYLADRIASRTVLIILPLLTMIGLLLLLVLSARSGSTWVIPIAVLSLVGYCYGALIAVYPVAITRAFGELAAPRIYGQIFTAWGLAGLLAPWISGFVFDRGGSYRFAIGMALVLAVMSALIVARSQLEPAN